jgi:hypothetical protein
MLPRDHVHEDEDYCKHCEELTCVHRGETAEARRHAWSTRVVARGLEQIAAGATYADVPRWAPRVTGTKRMRVHRKTPPAKAASKRTKKGATTPTKTRKKVSRASRESRKALLSVQLTVAFAIVSRRDQCFVKGLKYRFIFEGRASREPAIPIANSMNQSAIGPMTAPQSRHSVRAILTAIHAARPCSSVSPAATKSIAEIASSLSTIRL